MAAAIRDAITAAGGQLTAASRKTAARTAGYLDAKAPYLDYPKALTAGWPISSGVIEGTCRHLVKDRDITGARWGVATAEALLKLRALHQQRLRRLLDLPPRTRTRTQSPGPLRPHHLTLTPKELHPFRPGWPLFGRTATLNVAAYCALVSTVSAGQQRNGQVAGARHSLRISGSAGRVAESSRDRPPGQQLRDGNADITTAETVEFSTVAMPVSQ